MATVAEYLKQLRLGDLKMLRESEIYSITSRPRLRAEILYLKETRERLIDSLPQEES